MKKTHVFRAQLPCKKSVRIIYTIYLLEFRLISRSCIFSCLLMSWCLQLPPIDGDRHLWVRLLFRCEEVPGLAVVFVALGAQPVECLLGVANKVCAVVQVLLARAAQTKLGDVALLGFFVFVGVAPLNLGLGMIPSESPSVVPCQCSCVCVIIRMVVVNGFFAAAPFPHGFLALRR